MVSIKLDRQNKNIINTWWWTVDRVALFTVFAMMCFGAMMVATASPAVADRIGFDSFHFIRRQMVFLLVSVFLMFSMSLMSPIVVRRIAILGFLCGLVLLIGVLLFGVETNGAKRWIFIGGLSLQPSEFMKPLFIVFTAWILSEGKAGAKFRGIRLSFAFYLALAFLLIMQPDFGMFVVVTAVWGGQLFLAGMPMIWVAAIVCASVFILLMAYLFFPHVAHRIDNFISSDNSANYQVRKSLEAFDNGGIIGVGPGEGVVKQHLPDSHTDFIFAVIGEELGAIACIIVVFAYGFIVIRGFRRMLGETDLFLVYAVSGLLMQFGIQAIVNMGVALNLLPTKGMTLPFISYGGSSMLAISVAMGMMLALTKKRFGYIVKKTKLVWEEM